MKIVVIARRSESHTAEEFAPHLEVEAKKALQLMAEDFVREIYSLASGKGGLLVVEANDEEEARRRLGELPLVEMGMISLEILPVVPYRGIVAAAHA